MFRGPPLNGQVETAFPRPRRAAGARSASQKAAPLACRSTRVLAVRVTIHSGAGEGDLSADTVSRKPPWPSRTARTTSSPSCPDSAITSPALRSPGRTASATGRDVTSWHRGCWQCCRDGCGSASRGRGIVRRLPCALPGCTQDDHRRAPGRRNPHKSDLPPKSYRAGDYHVRAEGCCRNAKVPRRGSSLAPKGVRRRSKARPRPGYGYLPMCSPARCATVEATRQQAGISPAEISPVGERIGPRRLQFVITGQRALRKDESPCPRLFAVTSQPR